MTTEDPKPKRSRRKKNEVPPPGTPITEERNEEEQKAAAEAVADIDETKKIIEMRDKITEKPAEQPSAEPTAEEIVNEQIVQVVIKDKGLAVIAAVLTHAPEHAKLAKQAGRTNISSAWEALATHARHLAKITKDVPYWKKAGS